MAETIHIKLPDGSEKESVKDTMAVEVAEAIIRGWQSPQFVSLSN